MQKSFLQKSLFGFRALFLFGVFAGLLFSCGEGIRLFPFPVIERGLEWKSSAPVSYQKNVCRFETRQENQTNFQRKLPPPLAGIFTTSCDFLFAPFVPSHRIIFSFVTQITKTNEIAELFAKRAPPVSLFS